jgi:uncharacterized membrane protein
MLAVARQDVFGYQLVYLLHIASVIVAFAAAFVHPRLGGLAKRLPGDAASQLNQTIVAGSVKLHFPALVLAGLFGTALIPMSDELYEFSQLWISLSYVVWFAMIAVLFFLLIPAERRVAGDPRDADGEKKVAMFGGVLHLLLLVMLVLMVWKPGL